VGDRPFAVPSPDEIIAPSARLPERMLAVRVRYGGSVVALLRVEPPPWFSLNHLSL
jgi:UTP--glucose-1-phosphate uridylyltransferase